MCGRYVMARASADLVAGGGAEPTRLELTPNWNIAPTARVPILVELFDGQDAGGGTHRELHLARWGLVPPWATDLSVGSRAFNARSETVVSKPTFRSAVRSRRCAVPADGYYEWRSPEPGAIGPDGRAARKQPWYVHPAAEEAGPIWFAGLYEWWKDAEADASGHDAWVLSTTILTTAAPDPVADEPDGHDESDTALAELGRLHDRLPIGLDTATMEAWLAPGRLSGADEAAALVERVRAQAHETARGWRMRPADPAVGNVRNSGPQLIRGPRERQEPLL